MSWIKEVIEEIKKLDMSQKALRNFGVMIGGVFFLFSGWLIFRKSISSSRLIYLGVSASLICSGIFWPKVLTGTYRVWMGVAFFLGGMVSRVILLLLFYLAITPLGILGKIFKKEFLDLKIDKKVDSYWISKEKSVDYEKMY